MLALYAFYSYTHREILEVPSLWMRVTILCSQVGFGLVKIGLQHFIVLFDEYIIARVSIKKTPCMFILLIVCKLWFVKIGFRGFFSRFFIATHRGCERRPGRFGKVWGHQQPRALCQVLPDFFVLVICNNCLGSRSSPGGLWRT